MSRTIRRKNTKYPYLWYTREEFDAKRAEYEAGEWRGERRYFNHFHQEWIVYQARWWDHGVVAHASFDAYVAAKEARHHSDAGHPIHNHQILASLRRSIEKRYRSRRNHQLKSAVIRGEEEELLLTPFQRDISWYW